jgi:hypothetical protein
MIRASSVALVLTALLALPALGQEQAPARLSAEGRFLYADDDDWDWASPINTNQPCGLTAYGRMPWSALDWMEAGLDEVRGVLIGTPPVVGDYLTMADLKRVRSAGPKRSYEQRAHTPTVLRDLLKDSRPPNLIIMMQDTGPVQLPISAPEVEAAVEFVRRGGRLIILDDWTCYRAFVEPYVDFRRYLKAPPAQQAKVDEGLAKIDPWLAGVGATAAQLQAGVEIRMISRNGQRQPGLALLITVPPPDTRK